MSKLLDVMTAPWAITKNVLQEIGGIYLTHLRGEKIDIASVEARLGHPLNNEKIAVDIKDGVAIISAHGVVAKRANLFMQISGGVSTEILGNEIQAALDNKDVKAIVLDIDSPGGTVDGTFELADGIFNARGEKPIVALANGLMASAAYAFGAAADAVYMSGDTTHVGSIGVVTAHTDYSQYEEKIGIKTTEIYAGKYKRIASQHEPLTEEGREDIQASVDYLYTLFVERVATFRGVAVSAVLDDMADGRLFIGQQAIDAGLVDGVSTLDDLVAELSMGRMPEKQTSAKVSGAGDASDTDTESINLNNNEESDMDKHVLITAITSAFVAENCPAVAAELRDEGAATSKTAGADAERQRIQDVLTQSMPGHEALIEKLAFDGKTTGPEAAVQVLQAEKGNKKKAAKDITDDAAEITVDSTVDAGLDNDSTAGMSDEEKCQYMWDSDKSLHDEFASFDNFKAYQLNKGKARTLGNKKK